MKYIYFLFVILIILTACRVTQENPNIQTDEKIAENTIESSQSINKDESISEAKAAALAKAKAKLASKKETESQKDTQTAGDDEKYVFSYPYKCNLMGGIQYTYPERDMSYAETSIGPMKSIVVVRDGLSYHWSNTQGIIGSATYSKVSGDEEIPADLPPEMLKMIEDLQEEAKKTCTKWDLDVSVFEIPTSINFIDGDELAELDTNNPEDMAKVMEMGKSLMPDFSNLTEAELEVLEKQFEGLGEQFGGQ